MKSTILYDFEIQNLLKNGKGQIRRAIPIEFLPGYNPEWTGYRPIFEYGEFYLANSKGEPATKKIRCPFGAVGEKLWCKENAWIAPINFFDKDDCNKIDNLGNPRLVGYSADMNADSVRCAEDYGVKQTSSACMPQWASRLTIVPERIWTELLLDITDADAIQEGCFPVSFYGLDDDSFPNSPREQFRETWDSHAKPGYKWPDNPMVFVGDVVVK